MAGVPNYPEGYVFKDYAKRKNRNQIHNGVHIIRANEIGRRKNLLFRFLNYYSFLFSATKILKRMRPDFDVILLNESSPIISCKPGIVFAKKNKIKTLMYEMDLWPESLLAGGIKKNSLLYSYFKNVSSRIYSSCDKILVSTEEHINYIHQLSNCQNIDIEYLPQYAEPIFEMAQCSKNRNEVIDLMFAGNIGKAQSIDTIIEAARLLRDNNKFFFHIVGDGSELLRIKTKANELKLTNVKFYGNISITQMPKLYSFADIMLVTLENKPYANMTIPGKVQSYLAFGKPIIASIGGATNLLINKNCIGIAVGPESPTELAYAIMNINHDMLSNFSENASKFYFSHFSSDRFFRKLRSVLISLTKEDKL